MALKDVLTKPVKFKPKSWLEIMAEQLDPEDYQWLVDCIADTTNYSGSYIASKMTQAGYPVSPTTINNLRKLI
jgi:hypothetical protein